MVSTHDGPVLSIYACTRANHAHYSSIHVTFCGGSKHIKVTLGKKTWQVESVEHIEQII